MMQRTPYMKRFARLLLLIIVFSTISMNIDNSYMKSNSILTNTIPTSAAVTPTISISSPVNNSFVTGANGPVAVTLDILDPGDNAKLEQVPQIYVDGSWVDMIQTSSPASLMENFTYWLELDELSSGILGFPIKVINNNSQETQEVLVIHLDNGLPKLNKYNGDLEDGAFITDDFVVSINVTDDLSGVDNVSLTISELFGDFIKHQTIELNNETLFDNWDFEWLVKSNSWNLGPYELLFSLEDKAGATHNESIEVTVDYTNPLLSLLSPSNNSILSGNSAIRFSLQEPNTDLLGISFKIDNENKEVSKLNENLYEYILDTTSYEDGDISVSINTTNAAGLENSTNVNFKIDNVNPTGNLVFDPIIKGEQIMTLECNDLNGISRIRWRLDQKLYNDLPVEELQNFTFYSEKYKDGSHNLTIIIEDNAINPNQLILMYPIIIDNTVPQVSVSNLYYGKLIPNNFKIIIEIYDETPCELYYSVDNGGFYLVNKTDITNNYWTLPVGNLSVVHGYHYIVFKGVDSGGNFDEDTYMFVQYEAENPWFWVILIGSIAGGVAAILGTVFYIKNKNKIRV